VQSRLEEAECDRTRVLLARTHREARLSDDWRDHDILTRSPGSAVRLDLRWAYGAPNGTRRSGPSTRSPSQRGGRAAERRLDFTRDASTMRAWVGMLHQARPADAGTRDVARHDDPPGQGLEFPVASVLWTASPDEKAASTAAGACRGVATACVLAMAGARCRDSAGIGVSSIWEKKKRRPPAERQRLYYVG